MPSTRHERTSADGAASRACTQSGAFALLLSVGLFLVIPNWLQRPREVALGHYIADRINLATVLDTLDDDPIWQKYKSTNESAESMSIAQLLGVSVVVPGGATDKPTSTKPRLSEGRGKEAAPQILGPKFAGRLVPRPPKLVTATGMQNLEEMGPIANILTGLNDPQLLSNSMKESNFFAFSILRWGQKRNNLMYENVVAHSCSVTPLEVPTIPPGAPYFVPLLENQAMLKCLTLHDVRELARLELPAFSNPLQLQGQIQREVDLKPGSISADLFTASILGELLLLFVLVYFSAFAREAVSSTTFPAVGTLFGAFSRSPWTLFAMLVALWIPFVASAAMSVASREWLLMIFNAPILGAIVSIHLVLGRKSYFSSHWRRQPATPKSAG